MTMSMPAIHIGTLFIGREDREGNDGSSIATEDDDDTDVEAGVRARFLGARPPPTLRRAFRKEEDDNKDNGDEQGRRAQRRRHDAVDVRDALQGRAIVGVVHSLPEAPIVGDDRGEGGRGGSVADETITDGVKTTAMTEQGMRCW